MAYKMLESLFLHHQSLLKLKLDCYASCYILKVKTWSSGANWHNPALRLPVFYVLGDKVTNILHVVYVIKINYLAYF